MDFLRILSSALQKRFQTYESMGVADALKILESVTVDAVCSDFNMRDGTGLELLIKLRQKGVKVHEVSTVCHLLRQYHTPSKTVRTPLDVYGSP